MTRKHLDPTPQFCTAGQLLTTNTSFRKEILSPTATDIKHEKSFKIKNQALIRNHTSAILFLQKQLNSFVFHGKRNDGKIEKLQLN